eukprot:CAMPEP_0206471018 /NCGR_PEP_ID=MMETSP0324_2-20121206/31296_1 /ASSEMBLY_ACC=CAM_ASM_000836 /TAXON_ID=2866 /ORGANISM="Crypthecodinium cohnii, Strain Seligo" /LENGTH=126 /DNA_ID=CAMNT_0053945229 /DNA_START=145 /DNA_END=523 /DNA_ORIENTATION=+
MSSNEKGTTPLDNSNNVARGREKQEAHTSVAAAVGRACPGAEMFRRLDDARDPQADQQTGRGKDEARHVRAHEGHRWGYEALRAHMQASRQAHHWPPVGPAPRSDRSSFLNIRAGNAQASEPAMHG